MSENRIRELRKQRGVTLEALAARVGLDHSHLSRIERGERKLSTDQARAIASALNATTSELLGEPTPGELLIAPPAAGFAEDFAP